MQPDIWSLIRDLLIVALAALPMLIVLVWVAPSQRHPRTPRKARKQSRMPLAILGQGDYRRIVRPAGAAQETR